MPVIQYPADIASDTILRDGTTVHVRAVRDDDAAAVLALFGQLSERSLYYRFMTVPRIDLAEARKALGR